MNNISRIKIISCMAVIMLILIIIIGSFSIPIGISACSVLGIIYGYKNKDKNFLKWSLIALSIGIAFIIYTLILIKSM
ncbi:hypothetical protein QVN97_01170 [Bacteroides caecigallinarum]|nr:hypothetical protein [Bacteroides caecigallinarum]